MWSVHVADLMKEEEMNQMIAGDKNRCRLNCNSIRYRRKKE